MALFSDYEAAYQELLNSGMDAAQADTLARQLVTPAGESEYVANELINKGGFIGDPNQPGSNTFVATAAPPTANVLPPWMQGQVLPAGQMNELPNAQAAQDFIDAYGVDPRKLQDEGTMAIAALKGSYGEVPPQEIASIEAGYQAAPARLSTILAAGGNPEDAVTAIYDPLRTATKAALAEGRYRQPSEPGQRAEKEYSFVVQKGRFPGMADVTARMTPSGFLAQREFLPEYARTNIANVATLRGAGYLGAGSPTGVGAPGAIQVAPVNPAERSVGQLYRSPSNPSLVAIWTGAGWQVQQ